MGFFADLERILQSVQMYNCGSTAFQLDFEVFVVYEIYGLQQKMFPKICHNSRIIFPSF